MTLRIVIVLLLELAMHSASAAVPPLTLRGGLPHCEAVFQAGKGRVAFLGGSITEGGGWRDDVCDRLRTRFPNCEFTFVNAGLASTGSTTAAFRLERDVLAAGVPDLLFFEAAVNDDQDEQLTAEQAVRSYEGVVRHVRRVAPNCDVALIHFVNPHLLELAQRGERSVSVAAHERVADRYDAPSLDVPRVLAQEIASGRMDWDRYGGTHPGPAGHRLVADRVEEMLQVAWSRPGHSVEPWLLPPPLDPRCFAAGRLIEPGDLPDFHGEGFTLQIPDWKAIGGGTRERFETVPVLAADRLGATCTFTVTGNAVGLWVLAGPDAGRVLASVDGGSAREVELFHAFSPGLHYPRPVILADGLPDGPHRVTLTVAESHARASKGRAVRIVAVLVNVPRAEPRP